MAKDQSSTHPYRAIRASYTAKTITVYQAYPPEISNPAVEAQKFKPPFSRTRMTWIKPSFLWMAYRSGWATKQRQERVLAIEITREGFEWALEHSCMSHWDTKSEKTAMDKKQWQEKLHDSPVRVQWDPERDFEFRPLGYRSIQIGLGPEAVARYIDDWIVSITDITDLMHKTRDHVDEGNLEAAKKLLPTEETYSVSAELMEILQASC
jgi:hypothetical protein